MDLSKIFGRSASKPGGDESDPDMEAAIQFGAQVATLQSNLKAEQDKNAELTASLETANKALAASTDALRDEAKKAAVVAFGPTTPATNAEVAFLDACSDPAQLSACIARYRAATPAALSSNEAGKRETATTGEAAKPKTEADRLAKIEEERKKGQEAAEKRRQQQARTGRGGNR